jgi:O-antigen ligase
MNAHKNRSIQEENDWRANTIFFLLLLMLVSVFLSRALLSLSMITMVMVALLHKDIVNQLKNFLSNRLLLAMGILFLLPLASGLWSSNTEEWANIIRVKLPLIFFPLAFAGNWQLTQKHWHRIGFGFIAMVFVASFSSFFSYLQNMQEIHEGYLRSTIIKTPLNNDHIRFSWMVSIAVLLCLFFLHQNFKRGLKILFMVMAAWFAVYLHVLSARTGMFSFYIILFMYVVWMIKSFGNKRSAIAGLSILLLVPVLSWFFLPTFQNRIRYFLYDLSFVKEQKYLPGANDGSRVLSIRAGWNTLKENPLGVGIGDVKDETWKWYDQNVPGMLDSDKIDPSSEWLIYGNTAGWPGVIIFSMCMLIPFLLKIKRHRFFWITFNLIAAFSFIFDIGLEGQYGVFLYVFIICWWWKWFDAETTSDIPTAVRS